MLILQLPACRVNAQTAYIFQLFLCRYVNLLDTKSPGGRVLSGVTLCNYFLLGFLTLNANAI